MAERLKPSRDSLLVTVMKWARRFTIQLTFFYASQALINVPKRPGF